MNLIEVYTAAHGKISGGDQYRWNAFGSSARYIDFNEGTISCIADSKTMRCYAVEVFDQKNNIAWQWIDDEFKTAYLQECVKNNVDPTIAWDDVKFQSMSAAEILLKINQLTTY